MSQELIAIFRKYFEKDRQKYGTELCFALWKHAGLLEETRQYDDALLVWKEVTYLVQEVNEDRLLHASALEGVSDALFSLERHDEAATSRREVVDIYQAIHKSPSWLEAHAHYGLSYDLQLAGQNPEAIREAQTCIMQYRTLAFQDPGQYKKYLADGLRWLSYILFCAREYEQAFDEGHEAFNLYQSIIQDNPHILSIYVAHIHLQMLLSEFSNNETMTIKRGQHLIHYSNELIKIFPDERERTLIYATWIHSRNLDRFDRLTEANVTIQGALDWYEIVPADTPSAVEMHMQCLQQMAIALVAQGYPEKALGTFEEAIKIGKKFSSHPDIVDLLTWTIANRAVSLFEVGRYSEALTASQDAFSVIRGTESANTSTLVWCLRVAFIVQQFTKETEVAINGLQEAINLCRTSIITAENLPHRLDYLTNLSDCLVSMSEARADIGNEVEAMCLAQEGLDEIMKVKSTNLIRPWQNIQACSTHMDTLHNLSLRHAFNNNLSQALDLITKAGAYYKQRAQARNGLYPKFARILLSQGVLYCAAGRHEEGIEARNKLTDIQERLSFAFPGLACCVRLQLDRERGRSSWIALVAKLDLNCNHQDFDKE